MMGRRNDNPRIKAAARAAIVAAALFAFKCEAPIIEELQPETPASQQAKPAETAAKAEAAPAKVAKLEPSAETIVPLEPKPAASAKPVSPVASTQQPLAKAPVSAAPSASAKPATEKKIQFLGTSATTLDKDPLALDDKLKEIATTLKGTPKMNVKKIFDTLHTDAPNGMKMRNTGRGAPSTAAEALEKGGDCTEAAYVTVALLKAANVPGGAMLGHFEGSEPGMKHIVAYAILDNKRVIVDLQASKLGKTAKEGFVPEKELKLDEAAYMYYREYGDYYTDKKQWKDAIAHYEKALTIYEEDDYVHQKLGRAYEQSGDRKSAKKHFDRAKELEPKRAAATNTRASYNEAVSEADKAYEEGRYADCITYSQQALDSGERIPAEQRNSINFKINVCQANQAYEQGRFAGCVEYYQKALSSGEKLSANDRSTINGNMKLCQSKIPK